MGCYEILYWILLFNRHYILSLLETLASGSRYTVIILERGIIVPAASQFPQPRGFNSCHSEKNSIVLRILWYSVPLVQKYREAPESPLCVPKSTFFCIQPVQEYLGASGKIGKPVQNSKVVEVWFLNHFTYCRRSCTCCIRNGKLTHTHNSPKSHSLMMISPISSHFTFSHPQLDNYLRRWSLVIPLNLCTPSS